MMKKFLFSSPLTAAILAALTFAACTDSESIADGNGVNTVNTADNTIQFGTYMGTQQTRAYEGGYTGGAIANTSSDNGTKDLKTVGFGVFAYHSGYKTFADWSTWSLSTGVGTDSYSKGNSANQAPNFMYNEKITWNTALNNGNGGWDYAPVKYWPNGTDAANAGNDPSNTATEQGAQYLSFFAYAPYVAATSTPYSGTKPATPDQNWAVTNAVTTGESNNGIVAMSKNDETSDIQLKYVFESAADEKSAVDLLWGLRGQLSYSETDGDNNTVTTLGAKYNTDLTKQTVDEKVKFLFKHALARVGGSTSSTTAAGDKQICGLKVVVDVDTNSDDPNKGKSEQEKKADNTKTYFTSDFNPATTLVTIKDVKIRDQYTYSQESGSTITTTASDFANAGWFNIMKGEWTRTEKPNDEKGITYSVHASFEEDALNDNDGVYALNDEIKERTVSNDNGDNWTTSNSGGATGVSLDPKKVFANEDVPGLLLIPGGSDANTLYVTVDYIVRTADSKLSTGYSQVEQIITNKVTLDGKVLQPNKFYTLVMHLGLTSVKFEAVVANWSGGNDEYDEEGKETTSGDGDKTSIWLPSNVVSSNSTSTNVTAGTDKAVTVPATTTSYSITLSAEAIEAKVYTDAECTTEADATTSAAIDATYKTKVTVTLPANTTSKDKVYYVQIKDGASPANISKITLTQKAAEIDIIAAPKEGNAITISGSVTEGFVIAPTGNAPTLDFTIKDKSGNPINLTNADNKYTIKITCDDGTTQPSTPQTPTTTGFEVSLPTYPGTTDDRTWEFSVKVNDAPVKVFNVVQSKQ